MREILVKAVLTLVLVAGAILTDSHFKADEHEGQPEHCTNAKNAPKANKCDCKKMPEDHESGEGKGCDVEDVKCRVYCRKNKCYCFHPACDS